MTIDPPHSHQLPLTVSIAAVACADNDFTATFIDEATVTGPGLLSEPPLPCTRLGPGPPPAILLPPKGVSPEMVWAWESGRCCDVMMVVMWWWWGCDGDRMLADTKNQRQI